jgi:sec-independent protein translocase protein TatB
MSGLSFEHLVILLLAALFILGPERLPGAAATIGRTIRQLRQYASTARDQLKAEVGPEFEELRRPLQDLAALRSFDPKVAVTRYLFDERPSATRPSDPKPDPQPAVPGDRTPIDPEAT